MPHYKEAHEEEQETEAATYHYHLICNHFIDLIFKEIYSAYFTGFFKFSSFSGLASVDISLGISVSRLQSKHDPLLKVSCLFLNLTSFQISHFFSLSDGERNLLSASETKTTQKKILSYFRHISGQNQR